MAKYLVWLSNTKPLDGKTIVAPSAFKARQICADAWGKPVTEVLARFVDKESF